MEITAFKSNERGIVRKTLEGYHAFFPNPLPRAIPLSPEIILELEEGTAALHRLAGVSRLLPNPDLLIGPHLRLEAVLSSRIEGTEATVSDLLRYEVEDRSSIPGDVAEVANYVGALEYGLDRVKSGFPLVLRLIREIHERLMRGVRGESQAPGEFRRSQNWIGPPGCLLQDATFIPPPMDEMKDALADLERFLNEPGRLPLLVQVAMAHYQFEAIHPFLDGNGRVGRLLIPLVLCQRGVLDKPLLYMSAYFERNRFAYYDHLLMTSQNGDPTAWLSFFLKGVALQSKDAEERTVRLVDAQAELRTSLLSGGRSLTVIRLAEMLFSSPYVTAPGLVRQLGVTFPTAQKAIESLVEDGVLLELTGKPRDRLYYSPKIFAAVYGDLESEHEPEAEGSDHAEATQATGS